MNLLERVLTLLRANLMNVVEKADDPEKTLRQLQLDMRNQLVQVKTQVATAIAEGHKLRKRIEERKKEGEMWMKKAEQEIQYGHDDAARNALLRHNEIQKQVQRYKQQQKEQEQLIVTMRGALQKLEAKIVEVDTTIDILVTRKRNALLQQRVYDALNNPGSSKGKERVDKAKEAILESTARAQALADLTHNLDTQLEQLSQEQLVEQQLREMKFRQQQPQHTSPLSPTEPLLHEPARKRARVRRQAEGTEAEPQTQKDITFDYLNKLLDTPQSEH